MNNNNSDNKKNQDKQQQKKKLKILPLFSPLSLSILFRITQNLSLFLMKNHLKNMWWERAGEKPMLFILSLSLLFSLLVFSSSFFLSFFLFFFHFRLFFLCHYSFLSLSSSFFWSFSFSLSFFLSFFFLSFVLFVWNVLPRQLTPPPPTTKTKNHKIGFIFPPALIYYHKHTLLQLIKYNKMSIS